eukprot:9495393-Pyramimonas_sp.AAC.1
MLVSQGPSTQITRPKLQPNAIISTPRSCPTLSEARFNPAVLFLESFRFFLFSVYRNCTWKVGAAQAGQCASA